MTISRGEFARFGLDFDDSELAGIRAGAEQIGAALSEAEQWDCTTGQYPALARVPDIRAMKLGVQRLHRRERNLGRVVEWRQGRGGTWLPEHSPDDPDHAGKVFGIFAGQTKDLHVLAGEYSVERFLGRRPLDRNAAKCDWDSLAYLHDSWTVIDGIHDRCARTPREYLLFSQGQYLIAVATCGPCLRWLLAGGSLDAP